MNITYRVISPRPFKYPDDEAWREERIDDYLFGGLVVVNLIGGLLVYLGASYGELGPIIIWSVNCGLIGLAGTIIEG